ELHLDAGDEALLALLFSEESGAVLQVAEDDIDVVRAALHSAGLEGCVHDIGRPVEGRRLRVKTGAEDGFETDLPSLQRAWMHTSHAVQRRRDHPECADQELAAACDWSQPGIDPVWAPEQAVPARVESGERPRVAILREQGVNGQVEMAAAFDAAGFRAVDVHMTDLLEGRHRLADFSGFVACGGFSYGDVLGAGRGWAQSILNHAALREAFEAFLARPDRFALGVCNGCQVLSALRELVPGAEGWPSLQRNRSEQFEARLAQVEIPDSPSLFFRGMAGSRLPVSSAHGEGRMHFDAGALPQGLVALRYVDGQGQATERYPHNPNGSPGGVTGLTTPDGRVTILMPHPERTLRSVNFSWAPDHWDGESPWMQMFHNARRWVESTR
ncbi:MAG: phosphoribosylformylglycinamidine synthase subunit PurQ, partial [Xanthomonadales bacterium]|nr:phosphoribosylformylglycinamidine synthase subunit PurQ [Xanthomonadales bacterium]